MSIVVIFDNLIIQTMLNALEMDFIPVGSASKSGDAITFRMGIYEEGKWKKQYVFVVDGGNLESGAAVVEHVKEFYNTNVIHSAILTHPDIDHASGLRTVVEELDVKSVWMHRPWKYWKECQNYIQDGRITRSSWKRRLQDAYSYAYEVEQIALRKKIEINHAHQGYSLSTSSGAKVLTVLGPSKEFYLSLIEASDKTPAMRESARASTKAFSKGTNLVQEDWDFNTENLCEEHDYTSPENDMSIILLLQVANARVLLTGDAGTMALYKAIQFAVKNGLNLKDLDLLQIPHHGSRHNLSKGMLQHIGSPHGLICCTSQTNPHHPSPVITNALLRRGTKPCATKGRILNFVRGTVPMRSGYTPTAPESFTNSFYLSD